MNVQERRSGAVIVLAMDGKLDGSSAPALETQVTRLLSEGVKRVVFDCSGLEYISSAGLRAFLLAAKRLQTVGGRCGFAALSPAVREIFRLSGFLELLEVHHTVADACPEPPNHSNELTLMEELALLALNDKTGEQLELPPDALGHGLAGAIILELSLAGRIDTDLRQLTVINAAPTGDDLLDPWLSLFHTTASPTSVKFWLRELAVREEEIHQAAVDRLTQRGILRREERRLFWVFGVRRYPTVDNTERIEVRTRLSQLILGNDLPAPRDAILLSLIHGCHLSEYLFAGLDLKARQRRIETLAKTDLVGREVSKATAHSLDVLGRALSAMPPTL